MKNTKTGDKPTLRLTSKRLPTLQMTTWPNKPVNGAKNPRLATNQPKKYG